MEFVQGTVVLWRGPGVVQVGSDPDHHFVLDGLSPAEQVWLLEAARTRCDLGPPPGRTSARAPRPWTPTPAAARIAARLRAAARTSTGGAAHGGPLPSVRIDGVDALTGAAARILVRSGVDRLDLVDPTRLDAIVPGLFTDEDLGIPRAQALSHHLQDLGHVTVAPLGAPDVVVVSRARVPATMVATMLGVENRTHLLVTRHEGSVEVGPLVRPGRTPCAQCRALHLADADPHWPMAAREMATWPLPPPDLAVEGIASLEIARAVLEAVGHAELGASRLVRSGCPVVLRIDAGGDVHEIPCPPHPRCSCGASRQEGASMSPMSSPRTRARTGVP